MLYRKQQDQLQMLVLLLLYIILNLSFWADSIKLITNNINISTPGALNNKLIAI